MSSSTVSRYQESSVITSPTKIYDTSFDEEYTLDTIAKEAKFRLQRPHEQNHEAHHIRYNDCETNARDENEDEDSSTKVKNLIPNSLLLQRFLNGDIDLRSINQRDLKRLLTELEIKYKSLLITNSSIYNDKQALYYQIDTYKDILDEYNEILNQTKRQLKEKCRDFDVQKQILIDFELNYNQLKNILINYEKLIEEEEEIFIANESINEKFKRILNEKHQQYQQMNQLKSDLNEEKTRFKSLKEQIDFHYENSNDIDHSEQQKQLIREINDLKNRLQKFELDNSSLEQENKRYEAQLTRHKQQLDDVEQVEDELKQERRRLQRELRTARDQLENERTRSDVLQRENKRLRTLRQKDLLDDDLISPLLTNYSIDIQSISPIEDSI